MGVEIAVECDGYRCLRSVEYMGDISESRLDDFLERKGWLLLDDGYYCPKCKLAIEADTP